MHAKFRVKVSKEYIFKDKVNIYRLKFSVQEPAKIPKQNIYINLKNIYSMQFIIK